MKPIRLLLKLKNYCRQGLSCVTRLVCPGRTWLVRLKRRQPREIPPRLELHAPELRHILSEAERKAGATVLRTAQRLDVRFGASTWGVIEGIHQTHEEVLAWRHDRHPDDRR